MTHTPPKTPPGLPGHRPRRDRMFKMRLTVIEAEKLKSWAHENELSQADFVRFMVYGRTTFAPPNASKLEAICRQLSGISTNLNQAQHAINSARANGTLTEGQFAAMHKAISHGVEAWMAPLGELRAELRKLKPAKVDTHNGDELDAAK